MSDLIKNNLQETLAEFFSQQQSDVALPSGTLGSDFDAFFNGDNDDKKSARKRKQAQRERDESGQFFVSLSDHERKAKRAEARAEKAAAKRSEQARAIAVLDMETDPFDAQVRDRIAPFTACLYSDQFKPVIIWEENEEEFICKVCDAVEGLPGKFTIYAHNGGKFDWLFLIKRFRGRVSFKGRGIMAAQLGRHELRDSFHIIPEKLAAYQKQAFDYQKLTKANRKSNRQEIIDYMLSDCVYLFDIVKTFVKNYGLKISIGQAAMMLLKRKYPHVQNVSMHNDDFLRGFFFGGRVQCLQGRGRFRGDYKLYDVNSMYPDVMCRYQHPIGNVYRPRRGEPNEQTCFIDLKCFSKGAFPIRVEGVGTTFPNAFGRYRVSIHEYNMALKHNLIRNVQVNYVIDNELQTDFSDFILPLYNNRLLTKETLDRMKREGNEATAEFLNVKKDDIFYKLLMNNAYGKFAQNPRRFKEHYLTDFDARPDGADTETWGDFPDNLCADYAIWSRPLQRLRFNNVGTAASITGAARAMLLDGIMNADDPVYCDTDSIICKNIRNVPLHKTTLGAWDVEAEMSEVLIAGKKLYSYRKTDGSEKIRSKGTGGLKWSDMTDLIEGKELVMKARAPTLTRTGAQAYIDRKIRATV